MPRPLDHCGSCGSRLERPGTEGGSVCPSCGRSWYPLYSPTAGCALLRDGKVLLTKRGVDPEKGRWDVPGGYVEPGEDLCAGVRRELREEIGIEVQVTLDDLVQVTPHTYGADEDWVLSAGFVTNRFSGEPKLVDEIDEIRWVDREELDELDFAWENDRELARKALTTTEGEAHGS